MERTLFGHGNEHSVYKAKKEGYLLKVQNRRNHFFFSLLGFNPNLIKREYQEAKEYESKGVKIPETKFRVVNQKNYVMYQKEIPDDNSIPDIRQHLIAHNIPELVMRYNSSPDNFLSFQNEVYLLDFTPGFWASGLLDRLGVIKYRNYLRGKQKIKQGLTILKNKLC